MRGDKDVQRWGRIAVALVYGVTQGIFGHAAESNFWSARRTAARRVASSGPPLSLSSPTDALVLAQWPGRGAGLDFHGPEQSSVVPTAVHEQTLGEKIPVFAGDLPRWLGDVLSPYGNLRDVYLSKRPGAPLVIHLQDLHDSAEAQRNIALMVEALQDARGVSLVGLEGAQGAFATEAFRAFPDTEITKAVAAHFMEEGYLGGPEFAGITAKRAPLLWGVEEMARYKANVTAVKDSAVNRPAMELFLREARAVLDKIKSQRLSPPLLEFDRCFTSYQSRKMSLGAYARYLLKSSPAGAARAPNLVLLRDALVWEEALDFPRVERERARLLERLVKGVPKDSLNRLVEKSALYRLGRVSYGDYYRFFRALCEENGVALTEYGQLHDYVRYVLLAERIRRNDLLNELAALELDVQDRLTTTVLERRVVNAARHLGQLERLVRHSYTPADWTYHLLHEDEIRQVGLAVRTLAEEEGLPETLSPPSGEMIKPFEDFCLQALGRNGAMVRSLLEKMSAEKRPTAVLVAGGFHTEGMMQLLRQKEVSYVVVTPQVKGDLPKGHRSLDLLARDPVPLEKLFRGEMVNVSTPRIVASGNAGDPFVARAVGLFAALVLALHVFSTGAPARLIQPLPGVVAAKASRNSDGSAQVDMSGKGKQRHSLWVRQTGGSAGGLAVTVAGRHYVVQKKPGTPLEAALTALASTLVGLRRNLPVVIKGIGGILGSILPALAQGATLEGLSVSVVIPLGLWPWVSIVGLVGFFALALHSKFAQPLAKHVSARLADFRGRAPVVYYASIGVAKTLLFAATGFLVVPDLFLSFGYSPLVSWAMGFLWAVPVLWGWGPLGRAFKKGTTLKSVFVILKRDLSMRRQTDQWTHTRLWAAFGAFGLFALGIWLPLIGGFWTALVLASGFTVARDLGARSKSKDDPFIPPIFGYSLAAWALFTTPVAKVHFLVGDGDNVGASNRAIGKGLVGTVPGARAEGVLFSKRSLFWERRRWLADLASSNGKTRIVRGVGGDEYLAVSVGDGREVSHHLVNVVKQFNERGMVGKKSKEAFFLISKQLNAGQMNALKNLNASIALIRHEGQYKLSIDRSLDPSKSIDAWKNEIAQAIQGDSSDLSEIDLVGRAEVSAFTTSMGMVKAEDVVSTLAEIVDVDKGEWINPSGYVRWSKIPEVVLWGYRFAGDVLNVAKKGGPEERSRRRKKNRVYRASGDELKRLVSLHGVKAESVRETRKRWWRAFNFGRSGVDRLSRMLTPSAFHIRLARANPRYLYRLDMARYLENLDAVFAPRGFHELQGNAYAFGNDVIQKVAEVIRAHLSEKGFLSRSGPDTYYLAAKEKLSSKDIEKISKEINQKLKEIWKERSWSVFLAAYEVAEPTADPSEAEGWPFSGLAQLNQLGDAVKARGEKSKRQEEMFWGNFPPHEQAGEGAFIISYPTDGNQVNALNKAIEVGQKELARESVEKLKASSAEKVLPLVPSEESEEEAVSTREISELTPLDFVERMGLVARRYKRLMEAYRGCSSEELTEKIRGISRFDFRDPVKNTYQADDYFNMVVGMCTWVNSEGVETPDSDLLRLVLYERAVRLIEFAGKVKEGDELTKEEEREIKWVMIVFSPLAAAVPEESSDFAFGMDVAAVLTDLVFYIKNKEKYLETKKEMENYFESLSDGKDVKEWLIETKQEIQRAVEGERSPAPFFEFRLKTVGSTIAKMSNKSERYPRVQNLKDLMSGTRVVPLEPDETPIHWDQKVLGEISKIVEKLKETDPQAKVVELTKDQQEQGETNPDKKAEGYYHVNLLFKGLIFELQFKTPERYVTQKVGPRESVQGTQAHYVHKWQAFMGLLGWGGPELKLRAHRAPFAFDTTDNFKENFRFFWNRARRYTIVTPLDGIHLGDRQKPVDAMRLPRGATTADFLAHSRVTPLFTMTSYTPAYLVQDGVLGREALSLTTPLAMGAQITLRGPPVNISGGQQRGEIVNSSKTFRLWVKGIDPRDANSYREAGSEFLRKLGLEVGGRGNRPSNNLKEFLKKHDIDLKTLVFLVGSEQVTNEPFGGELKQGVIGRLVRHCADSGLRGTEKGEEREEIWLSLAKYLDGVDGFEKMLPASRAYLIKKGFESMVGKGLAPPDAKLLLTLLIVGLTVGFGLFLLPLDALAATEAMGGHSLFWGGMIGSSLDVGVWKKKGQKELKKRGEGNGLEGAALGQPMIVRHEEFNGEIYSRYRINEGQVPKQQMRVEEAFKKIQSDLPPDQLATLQEQVKSAIGTKKENAQAMVADTLDLAIAQSVARGDALSALKSALIKELSETHRLEEELVVTELGKLKAIAPEIWKIVTNDPSAQEFPQEFQNDGTSNGDRLAVLHTTLKDVLFGGGADLVRSGKSAIASLQGTFNEISGQIEEFKNDPASVQIVQNFRDISTYLLTMISLLNRDINPGSQRLAEIRFLSAVSVLEDVERKRIDQGYLKSLEAGVPVLLSQGRTIESAIRLITDDFIKKNPKKQNSIETLQGALLRATDDPSLRVNHPLAGRDVVVVATEPLTPFEIAELKKWGVKVQAIVMGGTQGMHGAIFAKAAGIPCVTVNDLRGVDEKSPHVAVFSEEGEVFFYPTRETKAKVLERQHRAHVLRALAEENAVNGSVPLSASPDDLDGVRKAAAVASTKGIGLFRTEHWYSRAGRGEVPALLGKDGKPQELFEEYLVDQLKKYGASIPHRPFAVRIFDYVSDERDKPIAGLPQSSQRGAAYILGEGASFARQEIRAVMRAYLENSQIQLFFPMVSTGDEAKRLRRMVEEEKDRFGSDQKNKLLSMKVGAMVETRASVQNIAEILPQFDFINIGTKDLTLDIFGKRSSDDQVSRLLNQLNREVIEAMVTVLKEAKKQEKPVTACGVLAGNEIFVPMAILFAENYGMGLSVPPTEVAQWNYWISLIDRKPQFLEKLQGLVDSAEGTTEMITEEALTLMKALKKEILESPEYKEKNETLYGEKIKNQKKLVDYVIKKIPDLTGAAEVEVEISAGPEAEVGVVVEEIPSIAPGRIRGRVTLSVSDEQIQRWAREFEDRSVPYVRAQAHTAVLAALVKHLKKPSENEDIPASVGLTEEAVRQMFGAGGQEEDIVKLQQARYEVLSETFLTIRQKFSPEDLLPLPGFGGTLSTEIVGTAMGDRAQKIDGWVRLASRLKPGGDLSLGSVEGLISKVQRSLEPSEVTEDFRPNPLAVALDDHFKSGGGVDSTQRELVAKFLTETDNSQKIKKMTKEGSTTLWKAVALLLGLNGSLSEGGKGTRYVYRIRRWFQALDVGILFHLSDVVSSEETFRDDVLREGLDGFNQVMALAGVLRDPHQALTESFAKGEDLLIYLSPNMAKGLKESLTPAEKTQIEMIALLSQRLTDGEDVEAAQWKTRRKRIVFAVVGTQGEVGEMGISKSQVMIALDRSGAKVDGLNRGSDYSSIKLQFTKFMPKGEEGVIDAKKMFDQLDINKVSLLALDVDGVSVDYSGVRERIVSFILALAGGLMTQVAPGIVDSLKRTKALAIQA